MRKNFPTLRLNKKHVYLDNAATSLKLGSVIKVINLFATKFPLNLHSNSDSDDYLFIEKTTRKARELIAKWINAKVDEISFVPSATHALNFLALSFADLLQSNHSIAITKAEHSSNAYPWINLSREKKLKLNYLLLNKQFAIDKEKISEKIDNSTIIVSFAHISNSLGSLNDIKEITRIVKLINPDCYVIVDGCQSSLYDLVNIKDSGIDALVFSSHKIYGPDGIGILWVREALAKKLPPLLWGGGKEFSPFSSNNSVSNYRKFEVGTISAAQIAGLGEVFNFASKLDWTSLITRQQKLKKHIINSLLTIKEIKIYNHETKSGILLFNIEGFHSQDVSSYLAKSKIFVRAGNFCSPFLRELIGKNSAIRLSLAIYNSKKEVNLLASQLQKFRIENCLE